MTTKFRPTLESLGERTLPSATSTSIPPTSPPGTVQPPPNPFPEPTPETPDERAERQVREMQELHDRLNVLLDQIRTTVNGINTILNNNVALQEQLKDPNLTPEERQAIQDTIKDGEDTIKFLIKRLNDLNNEYQDVVREFNFLVNQFADEDYYDPDYVPHNETGPQHNYDTPYYVTPEHLRPVLWPSVGPGVVVV
jgi:hypothetical protein